MAASQNMAGKIVGVVYFYLKIDLFYVEELKHEMCSICRKETGICNCVGCKAFFCANDFQNHRQWLSEEFEKIIEDRNQLQEQMSNKELIVKLRLELCDEINQWKNLIIRKVCCAADNAHHQVIHQLDNKQKNLEDEFNCITKQLRNFQEKQDFVENNFTDLKIVLTN